MDMETCARCKAMNACLVLQITSAKLECVTCATRITTNACLCFMLSFVRLICYSCVLNFHITCIEKIKQSVLFLLSLFQYKFKRNSVTTVMLQNVLLKR